MPKQLFIETLEERKLLAGDGSTETFILMGGMCVVSALGGKIGEALCPEGYHPEDCRNWAMGGTFIAVPVIGIPLASAISAIAG